MGGLVAKTGKFFNSDVGRVVAGVATGGASEIGRAAAGTARRSGVDPTASAAIGAIAGGSSQQALGANAPSSTMPVSGGMPTELQAAPVSASASLSASAKAATDQSNVLKQQAADAAAAASAKAQTDIDARIETPEEAEAARQRALASSQRFAGGKRRASQILTGVSLGGY